MSSVDARDLKKLIFEFRQLERGMEKLPEVHIKCKATVSRRGAAKMWGRKAERQRLGTQRTGEENAEIFMRQAGERRDPLFMDDTERSKAVGKIEKGLAQGIERGGKVGGILVYHLDIVGKAFVGWIRGHIKGEESEHGAMAPIKESTRKRKMILYGAKTILTATGQLARSLYYEVRRG